MSTVSTVKDLSPSDKILHERMMSGLEGRVEKEEVDNFVKKATSADAPAPISATASVIFAAIYGNVKCEPKDMPWKGNESIWGIGGAGGTSIGLMYTAYDSWEAFFSNTTGFHVQGIADGGGVLQINWFNKSGVPVGQFNGAMAGAGGLEGGGSWRWKKN